MSRGSPCARCGHDRDLHFENAHNCLAIYCECREWDDPNPAPADGAWSFAIGDRVRHATGTFGKVRARRVGTSAHGAPQNQYRMKWDHSTVEDSIFHPEYMLDPWGNQ